MERDVPDVTHPLGSERFRRQVVDTVESLSERRVGKDRVRESEFDDAGREVDGRPEVVPADDERVSPGEATSGRG